VYEVDTAVLMLEELDEELTYYFKSLIRIVSLGLTKKKQKEWGLNQPVLRVA